MDALYRFSTVCGCAGCVVASTSVARVPGMTLWALSAPAEFAGESGMGDHIREWRAMLRRRSSLRFQISIPRKAISLNGPPPFNAWTSIDEVRHQVPRQCASTLCSSVLEASLPCRMPYLLAISGADFPCWMAQATCCPSRTTFASSSSLARKALGALPTVAGGVLRDWGVMPDDGGVEERCERAMGGGAATKKVVMTCLTLGRGANSSAGRYESL